MKNILEQAMNKVNVVGKLLQAAVFDGSLKDGRKYLRANLTIKVTQTYGGREEVSEIPVSMFAAQYTNDGRPNPGYSQIQDLTNMKSAQTVGYDNADVVRISGANLRENNFVSKSGQLIDGWQINTSFINLGKGDGVASFAADIFIMDMSRETDRDGDETGRLIIKGGLVQYGGRLDVVEFVVENPEAVDFVERNWNINDTVGVKGRIRVSSREEKASGASSSWGEDVPDMTTRTIRELVITTGNDEGKEEEFAYDPADIKKAFNVRKANIEQLQIDAKNASAKKPAAPAATASKYSWE